MPPLSYNEFERLALITVTLKCIEWEWHKSLPVNGENLWNYQFRQKCEIYTEMQWTFGIQAILDTINQLSWHLITFGKSWPQELPVEHTVVLQNNKNTWER